MDRIIFLAIVAGLFLLLDVYNFMGMKSLAKAVRLSQTAYVVASLFSYTALIYMIFYNIRQANHLSHETVNLINGVIFAIVVFKFIFGAFLLLHDGTRLLMAGFHYVKGWMGYMRPDEVFLPDRNAPMTMLGLMAAGIPFLSMMYGITKGKYQYTVQKVEIELPHLPEAFDGYKIVQISDVHSGSFDSKEKVKLGIDMINSLDAHIVVFTGDLVNSDKDEIDPYIPLFADISARDGKFAVLGNHDYMGVYRSKTPDAYKMDLYQKFEDMGFDLMNNEHRRLEKNGQTIHLIGVENWGDSRWFPKEGDLDAAVDGLSSDHVNILLSHDPTHWEKIVRDHPFKVDLTLSGHTHGFQFGIKWADFQWSPAQFRYKYWAGLYNENARYLYINRGFGFLGFPGRVGMWPEITEITLTRPSKEI